MCHNLTAAKPSGGGTRSCPHRELLSNRRVPAELSMATWTSTISSEAGAEQRPLGPCRLRLHSPHARKRGEGRSSQSPSSRRLHVPGIRPRRRCRLSSRRLAYLRLGGALLWSLDPGRGGRRSPSQLQYWTSKTGGCNPPRRLPTSSPLVSTHSGGVADVLIHALRCLPEFEALVMVQSAVSQALLSIDFLKSKLPGNRNGRVREILDLVLPRADSLLEVLAHTHFTRQVSKSRCTWTSRA